MVSGGKVNILQKKRVNGVNGVAFTGSWLPILHLSFLSDVMSRQKRLFPTITKSGERCKNLRLQSIGWLNNLYNFFLLVFAQEPFG